MPHKSNLTRDEATELGSELTSDSSEGRLGMAHPDDPK
jgi:hypothetical protein